MGLRPADFWELTLWEFSVLLDAASRRDLRARRFQAAMTANLMNCWVKRGHRVTADDLVPLPGSAGARRLQNMTEGERAKWLEDRRAARAEKKRRADE